MKKLCLIIATLLATPLLAHASAEPGVPARQVIEPVMVDIPAGSFMMGDASGRGQASERPHHLVRIRAFKMGKYEVTFAQYDAFADATGRARPKQIPELNVGRGEHPVSMVSWQDAVDYAAWLSAQTGKRYRLPTEAEWEYSARAGTTGDYFWGTDAATNYANVGSADAVAGTSGKDIWMSYAPVGQLAANPFGLHDVFGNVWEWTADCFNQNFDGAPSDGSAWMSGDCSKHIIKGDSFHNGPLPATVSTRGGVAGRNPTLGFRLAQEI